MVNSNPNRRSPVAYPTPVAIPSGILWTNIAVTIRTACLESCKLSSAICHWLVSRYRAVSQKNRAPANIPSTISATLPWRNPCSARLNTDAEIIMPPARAHESLSQRPDNVRAKANGSAPRPIARSVRSAIMGEMSTKNSLAERRQRRKIVGKWTRC
jgi:hypothetical protein